MKKLILYFFLSLISACSPYIHPNPNDKPSPAPLKTLSSEQSEQLDLALSMPYRIDQVLSKAVTDPIEIPEKMIKLLVDNKICTNSYTKETKPSGDFKETIVVSGESCPISIEKLLVKDSYTTGQEQLVYKFKVKTPDLVSLFGFTFFEANCAVQQKQDQNKDYIYYHSGSVTVGLYKLERLQITLSGLGKLNFITKNSLRKHTLDFNMPKFSPEKLLFETELKDMKKNYKLIRNSKEVQWSESNLSQFIKFLSID